MSRVSTEHVRHAAWGRCAGETSSSGQHLAELGTLCRVGTLVRSGPSAAPGKPNETALGFVTWLSLVIPLSHSVFTRNHDDSRELPGGTEPCPDLDSQPHWRFSPLISALNSSSLTKGFQHLPATLPGDSGHSGHGGLLWGASRVDTWRNHTHLRSPSSDAKLWTMSNVYITSTPYQHPSLPGLRNGWLKWRLKSGRVVTCWRVLVLMMFEMLMCHAQRRTKRHDLSWLTASFICAHSTCSIKTTGAKAYILGPVTVSCRARKRHRFWQSKPCETEAIHGTAATPFQNTRGD